MRAASRLGSGWLCGAALLGTVAVFVVPIRFAAGQGFPTEQALVAASSSAFAQAGATGTGASTRALDDLVAFWEGFHLLKAVLAVLLVTVLLTLESRLRRAAAARRPTGRVAASGAGAAYGGVVVWLVGALTVLAANLQGALAPLASVASLLPTGRPPSELGPVLGELRRQVTAAPTGSGGDLAGTLLADFTHYHVVFAAMATAVGVAMTALAVRAVATRWQLRRTHQRAQPIWLWQTTLWGGASALYLLLAVANMSTARNPAPALLAALAGGG